MCNFTSRFCIRPREGLLVSAKMSPKCATLPRVFAFDHANPWEGLRVSAKMSPKCATLPRVFAFDHANPWEGLRMSAKVSPKRATLTSVADFDHANPWEGLLVPPKICHFTTRSVARPRQSIVIFECGADRQGVIFTTRSRARPRQSMVRIAFPTEASVPAPAFKKNI